MTRSVDEDGSQAPRIVEEHSVNMFNKAQSILGDRLAERRRDPDRGVRVTVVDLNDADVAALRDAATRLGIGDWVRLERADPAALHAWERLRHDLISLQDARPRVLQMYPTPDPGYQRPPVRIHLDASAEATAADLHARFGDFVSLHVGALIYPPNPHLARGTRSRATNPERDLVDPEEIRIELDGPLAIRSGQTETHALLLSNIGDHEVTVNTNGSLTAVIVDPNTATPVGGFTGMQILPLITFTADPGQTVRIPLLVGTASFNPNLGYTVPPGTWHLYAPMDLADGRHLVTPALALTVTD